MLEQESSYKIESEKEKVKPNLLKDFDTCLDVVSAIEKELSENIEPEDRRILRQNMSNALADLEEQRDWLSDEEKESFKKKIVSGFQGLGGFNRYSVCGDGSIGLVQSHSTEPCINKAQELDVATPKLFGSKF